MHAADVIHILLSLSVCFLSMTLLCMHGRTGAGMDGRLNKILVPSTHIASRLTSHCRPVGSGGGKKMKESKWRDFGEVRNRVDRLPNGEGFIHPKDQKKREKVFDLRRSAFLVEDSFFTTLSAH